MTDFIPYGSQWIDDEDINAVVGALQSDRITTGEMVARFERAVAGYCGADYGVAVSSGTAALHTACSVAGISYGDEVITTPITFVATTAAVLACGGTPVLVDVEPDTVNISVDMIAQAITPRTKAIMPVDFAGHPVDLDCINTIARKHGLVVIEDACHALGARYRGQQVGGISDMTVLSFHPVKAITTGEGGMVLTNNEDYYRKLLRFRNHNIEHSPEHWRYSIRTIGCNYRLTDFQCALGLSQLQKLDWFIQRRREIAAVYLDALSGVPGIELPVEKDYALSAYHLFVIRLRDRATRDRFIREMLDASVGVQVHYTPVHKLGLKEKILRYGGLTVAGGYADRAVSLPIFPRMSDADVDRVIDTVKEIVRKIC